MAINPISYTEKVTGSFLRYQLTRNSPLVKGSYISFSRAIRKGA